MSMKQRLLATLVIATVLAVLAWTVPLWFLPLLLEFVGANRTWIQDAVTIVQVVLWLGAGLVWLWELPELWNKLNAPEGPTPRRIGAPDENGEGGGSTARLPAPRKGSQAAHLFICYKRDAAEDKQLADYLSRQLTAQGHQVFIGGGMASLEQIGRQLEVSDFLVVLLSQESADSEMVRAEMRRAYEYRKLQPRPRTLLVRMNYEELLPYRIEVFSDSLQYMVWRSEADNEGVCQAILAAIKGSLSQRLPVEARLPSGTSELSEDGRVVTGQPSSQAPMPEFDPRFLATPGQVVMLRDRFYVERDADAELEEAIVKPGTAITIRAPRQSGKTSLLARGIDHAKKRGLKVVFIDFQALEHEQLSLYDAFLRTLAMTICRELGLDESKVEQAWRSSSGAQQKLTSFLEDHALPESEGPIILAMDKADRLLLEETTFYSDFFRLVRSWHNRRATHSDPWEKLNLVLVISTEPELLVNDINQSPFNVGLILNLQDFTAPQVKRLNQRHGSPLEDAELQELMDLLSGQPYLTRQALYKVARRELTWSDLREKAATDQGPFADHLRRLYWILHDKPQLKAALKEVIDSQRCPNESCCDRLLRAGLIKGGGDLYTCRCELYKLYFKDKLS